MTFLVAQIWLADTDKKLSLTDSGVFGAITTSAVALTLLSLIALGLGALFRSVPGAIGAFVATVLILPEVLSMLPFSAVDTTMKYFPAQAASSLGSVARVENTIAPGTAVSHSPCGRRRSWRRRRYCSSDATYDVRGTRYEL